MHVIARNTILHEISAFCQIRVWRRSKRSKSIISNKCLILQALPRLHNANIHEIHAVLEKKRSIHHGLRDTGTEMPERKSDKNKKFTYSTYRLSRKPLMVPRNRTIHQVHLCISNRKYRLQCVKQIRLRENTEIRNINKLRAKQKCGFRG